MAYTGTEVKIHLGHLGLMTDLPPADIPLGGLILANNVLFAPGFIQKAPGSIVYNSSALSSGIVALVDYWPTDVQQRLIVATADGKIYRDIGDRTFSSSTAITTGLGVLTPKSMFVTGGKETATSSKHLFFISGGQNQIKVLTNDGHTFADIAQPSVDWTVTRYPKVGLIHRNRFVVFMGQNMYMSDAANHENFTSNTITDVVYPGEGGDILGAHIYKGRLFAFKEGGFVYYYNDDDPDEDNWFWQKLANNFGLSSPHGICEIDDDMIAVNSNGAPVSYSATQKLGSVESADLMRILKIKDFFRSFFSVQGLDVCHAVFYEERKLLFITYRTKHNTKNDVMLVVDFNGDQPRPCFWNQNAPDCIAFRKDILGIARPMIGSWDGYVHLLDRNTVTTTYGDYTGEFKTAHHDAGSPSTRKIYDWVALEFIPTRTQTIDIKVFIDNKYIETLTFTMDIRDDGSSSNLQDVNNYGREGSQTTMMPLHGTGRRISFHVLGGGLEVDFKIASITYGFRSGDQGATKDLD